MAHESEDLKEHDEEPRRELVEGVVARIAALPFGHANDVPRRWRGCDAAAGGDGGEIQWQGCLLGTNARAWRHGIPAEIVASL